MPSSTPIPAWQSFAQVGVLAAVLLYGLVLRPQAFGQAPLPLEVLFPLVAVWVVAQLRLCGHRWQDIEKGIVQRMGQGVPGFFVLFAIGILIGSWIVCGTIPMLVHVGVQLIDPRWLYLLAFVVPAVFSTLTGTEDTGTMIESLVPWHPTALFMVATLGVRVIDYWPWQVLTLANLVVAPVLALTGIGCGYPRRR